MKVPKDIPVWGNNCYRGECPTENVELASFFSRIRREYPTSYGAIAVHIRNEGLRERGQVSAMIRYSAEGLVKGAPDIFLPGCPSLLIEMKRQNPQLSSISKEQIGYLRAALVTGSMACVALGAVAAWEAFNHWLATYGK
jgi:hypothetical protein